MNVRTMIFACAVALVLGCIGLGAAPNAAAARPSDERSAGQLTSKVYSELQDEIFKNFSIMHGSVKVPCYASAFSTLSKALNLALRDPSKMSVPNGTCPHCGLKASGGPTCTICGEALPGGQTGVGTPIETLSYKGETDPSFQVSGVVTRIRTLNGEIDADVSVDVTAHHKCTKDDDETDCATFHAVVEGHVSWAESDDHNTVSNIKVSKVKLTFKSLLCCKKMPRLPYTIVWEPDSESPTINFGDKQLQKGEPAAFPSPAPSAPAAASPKPSEKPGETLKSDTPINKDSGYVPTAAPSTPASSGSESGTGTNRAENEHSSLTVPSIAGSSDEIFGTSVADDEPGPHSVLVSEIDSNGNDRSYVGKTDEHGHFHFKLAPALAIGLTGVEVVRITRLLRNGTPAESAVCRVSDVPAHLVDTQPVERVPANGPAITEANSAYDVGPQNHGTMEVATRGTDPLDERMIVDGKPVEKLAASSRSGVYQLDPNTPYGEHTFQIASNGHLTNAYHAYVISEHFNPLPHMHPGGKYPVVLSVEGAPADTYVTLRIATGATFEDGSTQTKVRVIGGVAQTSIIAGPPGPIQIRSQLNVDMPGEWSLPGT